MHHPSLCVCVRGPINIPQYVNLVGLHAMHEIKLSHTVPNLKTHSYTRYLAYTNTMQTDVDPTLLYACWNQTMVNSLGTALEEHTKENETDWRTCRKGRPSDQNSSWPGKSEDNSKG